MPSTINADNGVVSGSSGVKTTADTSGVLALQSNGSTGLTLDTSLNVGIGTASPTASSNNRTLTLNSVATFGSLIDFKSNETLNLRIFSGVANSVLSVKTATPLTFETNDIERGRFDSAGEFLLGTTSAGASQRLAIVGAETLCMMKNTSATSSTQRTTILFRDNGDNSVGTIKTSTAGINLTGVTGITFPATQSASADANTLDDYEEGTWTPSDGSGAGLTLSTSFSTYTKVGRLVTCSAKIDYPSTASTATTRINGLPFTSSSNNHAASTMFTDSGTYFTNIVVESASYLLPHNLAGAQLTNVNLSAKRLIFTVSYIV